VVSLDAELHGHERQAAEELEPWKTHHEDRGVIDASPVAITLAVICTKTQMGHARVAALQSAGTTSAPASM